MKKRTKIEHRRCVGDMKGAVYVVESAGGRGAKGTRSVVSRYTAPQAGEIVYESKRRLHDSLWFAPDDVAYTVCSSGRVHHSRGGSWRSEKLSAQSLHAVWGTSDEHVLVGGRRSEIFEWRGASWRRLPLTNGLEALGDSTILAFGGTGPDDIYVVADPVNLYAPHCSVIHFDGHRWTPLHLGVFKGRRYVERAKRGITTPVNSILCRGRDEVYLCGHSGKLLMGNVQDGWHRMLDIPRRRKLYCLAEINSQIYVGFGDDAWQTVGGSCGIATVDGDFQIVRDDLVPWHLTSRNDRLYVTWRGGFGVFDGRHWLLHGEPDFPR